jgi:hypothetical protein
MDNFDVQLQAWRSQLESLGGVTSEIAEGAARDLEKLIKKSIANQTDVDGAAWPERKKGTGALLKGAAGFVKVIAYKTYLVAVLPFPYSLHHWGKAKNVKAKRPVLPTKDQNGWIVIMADNCSKAFLNRMKSK